MAEAAERWIACLPNNPGGWGFRGEARSHTGDLDGAIRDLTHAVELDPGYSFAVLRLATLHEERHDPVAAGKLIFGLAREGREQSGRVFARALELSATLHENRYVPRWIHGLAAAADTDGATAMAALDGVVRAFPQHLSAWDDAAFARETTGPLAECRLHRLVEAEGFDAAWELLIRRDNATPTWGRAAAFLLEMESENRGPDGTCIRIERHGGALRRVPASCGMAATVLFQAGRAKVALGLYERYLQLPDIGPWFLVSHALLLRTLGREADAHAISVRALELPGADGPEAIYHRLWVAVHDALADRAEAVRSLPKLSEDELSTAERSLYALGRALAECLGRPGDAKAFARARHWLSKCDVAHEPRLPRRVRRRIAREAGGPLAWIWGRLR